MRKAVLLLTAAISLTLCVSSAFAESITISFGDDVLRTQDVGITDLIKETFGGSYFPVTIRNVPGSDGTVSNVLCTDESGKHLIITVKANDDGSKETLGIRETDIGTPEEFEAYCSNKDVNEYEMWEILERADLIELYKNSHPYLDDMNYIPGENTKTVQEIGYSHIWRVLAVRTLGDNGGEIEHLYENVPAFFFDEFVKADETDLYYKETIKPAFLEKLM